MTLQDAWVTSQPGQDPRLFWELGWQRIQKLMSIENLHWQQHATLLPKRVQKLVSLCHQITHNSPLDELAQLQPQLQQLEEDICWIEHQQAQIWRTHSRV